MNKLKQNNGITLITLIITIIVLLILAGIVISMVAGDNGILNKVSDAKVKNDEAKIDEEVRLARMEALTNINRKEYIDSDGYEVTIPAGFAVSPRKGEQNVETGLVILDSDGNEYVWIPVFEKTVGRDWGISCTDINQKIESNQDYKKTDDYWKDIEALLISSNKNGYTRSYDKGKYWKDGWYGSSNYGQYGYKNESGQFVYYSNGNMNEEEYNTMYKNMLISIFENKGFYIGRYEMGIAVVNTTTEASRVIRKGMNEYRSQRQKDESSNTNEKPSIENMTAPISKANAVAYNHITQSQAEMLAESVNYKDVTSSLMFGVQWKIVCVFIEHFDKNPQKGDLTTEWLKSGTYGIKWGNYKRSTFTMDRGFYTISSDQDNVEWEIKGIKSEPGDWLCTTGASDQNCSLNIYDFAGNLSEWTLEKHEDPIPCVYRSFYFRWDNVPCAFEPGYENTYYSSRFASGRISFFIK